jgi:exonuclease SbcD
MGAALARVGPTAPGGRPRPRAWSRTRSWRERRAATASASSWPSAGRRASPAAAFSGVDYVALGHLHGPQRVGRRGRYAGSPLAFSFSEAAQRKSVCLVEVAPGAEPVVRPVPCPVHRGLARLRGTLDELLADPRHAAAERCWVQATLTDPIRPSDAMERLRVRFPHTAALGFEPLGDGARAASGSYGARLAGLGDEELAARFVQDARGVPPTEEELELLRGALGHRAVEAVA